MLHGCPQGHSLPEDPSPRWRERFHREPDTLRGATRRGPAAPHSLAQARLSPPGHSRRPATPGGSGQSHWSTCRGNQRSEVEVGVGGVDRETLPFPSPHSATALPGPGRSSSPRPLGSGPQHQAAVESGVRPSWPLYSFPRRRGRHLGNPRFLSDPAPEEQGLPCPDQCVGG